MEEIALVDYHLVQLLMEEPSIKFDPEKHCPLKHMPGFWQIPEKHRIPISTPKQLTTIAGVVDADVLVAVAVDAVEVVELVVET
jgi:hypothetical protein